jgi:hypothetical protein
VVETLLILLRISLFLFFAGIVVFLLNVNLTIFKLVPDWIAICIALYGCTTLMPIVRHDSPYYTSPPSSVWPIIQGMALFVSLTSAGIQKRVEETTLKSPSEIDTRALDKDHELERFFAGLPSFRSSKVVADPLPSLFSGQMWNLCGALDGLLDHTLSSDLLPESVKI